MIWDEKTPCCHPNCRPWATALARGKGRTPRLSPHAPEADGNASRHGSHRPPSLCTREKRPDLPSWHKVSLVLSFRYLNTVIIVRIREKSKSFFEKIHKNFGRFLGSFIDFFIVLCYNKKRATPAGRCSLSRNFL